MSLFVTSIDYSVLIPLFDFVSPRLGFPAATETTSWPACTRMLSQGSSSKKASASDMHRKVLHCAASVHYGHIVSLLAAALLSNE